MRQMFSQPAEITLLVSLFFFLFKFFGVKNKIPLDIWLQFIKSILLMQTNLLLLVTRVPTIC